MFSPFSASLYGHSNMCILHQARWLLQLPPAATQVVSICTYNDMCPYNFIHYKINACLPSISELVHAFQFLQTKHKWYNGCLTSWSTPLLESSTTEPLSTTADVIVTSLRKLQTLFTMQLNVHRRLPVS